MEDFTPFFTKDGSVGLYSKENKDVYHSAFGALSEAYDKFILPANFENYFKYKKEIKILDLCYGIGYNTKSFLNYFFQNLSFLTENNVSIDNDNICNVKCIKTIDSNNIKQGKYNNTIGLNNFFVQSDFTKVKNYNICINAIDINNNLMKISPFLKSSRVFPGSKTSGIADVDKYLRQNIKYKKIYKLVPEVNMILLINLMKTYGESYLSPELIKLINNKNYAKYFDANIKRFFAFYASKVYNLSSDGNNLTFLHNIYYDYISKSYKNTLKVLENNEISIKYINDDARHFLLSENSRYDFIFLDAFSPSKCPALWTYDFFSLLYNHLSDDGKILTYSNSAAVRNAMIKNNFYIEKIFNSNENRFTGTIAVKNKNLINNNLDDFDIGLLKTKAGIVYRDENLSDDNKTIIARRERELADSDLISGTRYIKNFKGEYNGI